MRNFTKFLTLIAFLSYGATSFAQVTLASWTFSNNSLNDTIQNATLPLNAGAAIRTEGTAAITMTNGASDYAATATGWDNGAGVKNWNINIATTGYENITLSSKQRSGNTNPGPVNWKVQYKVGFAGTWTDLTGGNVSVGNDWNGVLTNLAMPAECNDQAMVYIRWIMVDNTGVGGGSVTASGTSKIDDIYIKGTSLSGIEEELYLSGISFYPNPVKNILNIESVKKITRITIYNIAGVCVYDKKENNEKISVNISTFKKGIYFLSINNSSNLIKKIIIE